VTRRTMADVRAANRAAGMCWFDRGSMAFFGSRIESALIAGRYFITSEKGFNATDPRRFSVREALPTGSIDTVGEFRGYATLDDARDAIAELRKATK
jgi:hypothetical protein